ncbi:peptidylprolyl isomerase [Verticiella sediminum]|uniref:Peptidyl-prolyl cis-trans isomerase n=1 Tax=Verticiella sediminum TaxID=1247510 RepID=A0A556A998_9BURK|nr:FKBP-type peptidyl-prolyl cis-trans isomerase [Verticiella sediminum]TSH89466.1 peptidylprolyl isomerase [Verticiella sediminum]
MQETSYVTLHYRITLASGAGAGQVFADTFTGRPATLQLGVGQWAPGMEAALLGRSEGESASFELAPADAYGERNPELLQRVSRAMLREHAGTDQDFNPGDMVEFTAPNGGRYAGILKEMHEDHAVFDFNHPMAGARLKVDVAILGVL